MALLMPRSGSMQEYTTKFWWQAITLKVSLQDHPTIMKYTSGLHTLIIVEPSQSLWYLEHRCDGDDNREKEPILQWEKCKEGQRRSPEGQEEYWEW